MESHSGAVTMYGRMSGDRSSTDYESSVSSADPKIAGRQLRTKKLEAFLVPCLTLNDLLEKNAMTSIGPSSNRRGASRVQDSARPRLFQVYSAVDPV